MAYLTDLVVKYFLLPSNYQVSRSRRKAAVFQLLVHVMAMLRNYYYFSDSQEAMVTGNQIIFKYNVTSQQIGQIDLACHR